MSAVLSCWQGARWMQTLCDYRGGQGRSPTTDASALSRSGLGMTRRVVAGDSVCVLILGVDVWTVWYWRAVMRRRRRRRTWRAVVCAVRPPSKKEPRCLGPSRKFCVVPFVELGILVRSYQRSLEILQFCGACLLVLLRYYSSTLVLVYRP